MEEDTGTMMPVLSVIVPGLSAGEPSTDDLTQWEHHQGQIRLLSTIDQNPRLHQDSCPP